MPPFIKAIECMFVCSFLITIVTELLGDISMFMLLSDIFFVVLQATHILLCWCCVYCVFLVPNVVLLLWLLLVLLAED